MICAANYHSTVQGCIQPSCCCSMCLLCSGDLEVQEAEEHHFLSKALLRAAAVTEKASRVAPLVNSWKFQAGGASVTFQGLSPLWGRFCGSSLSTLQELYGLGSWAAVLNFQGLGIQIVCGQYAYFWLWQSEIFLVRTSAASHLYCCAGTSATTLTCCAFYHLMTFLDSLQILPYTQVLGRRWTRTVLMSPRSFTAFLGVEN